MALLGLGASFPPTLLIDFWLWWEARTVSDSWINGFAGPFIIIQMPIVATIIIGVVAALRRKGLSGWFFAMFILGSYVVLFWSIGLVERVRIEPWKDFAIRARPLVEAVERYERANGKPPLDLGHLVPMYIERLPHMPGGLRVEIETGERVESSGQDKWRLVVRLIPVPGSFGDWLEYRPSGDFGDDNDVHFNDDFRIGNWRYFPE